MGTESGRGSGVGSMRRAILLLGAALLFAAGSSTAAAQTFDGGLQLVGPDITPGRYVAMNVDGCYWERLSGVSGEFEDIVANDFVGTAQQVVVDIALSDVAFDSSACAPWTPVSDAGLVSAGSMGNGSWIVGTQLFPGQYRTADAVDGCYWARLSGFGGGAADRIANDFVSEGRPVVEIRASDAGFLSSRCGTWEPLFSLPARCDSKFVTIDLNLNGGDGVGTSGDDVIMGTPGGDVINALGGDDTVCVGEGPDTVRGGGGGDTIYGGDAGDEIDGQGGGDTIHGGAGADIIAGRGAADVIFGDGGDDTIDGHNGVDIIDGGGGDDVIKGQTGADTLYGGSADDDLLGGNGNDTFYGGDGVDKCAGNLGPADAADASSCETTPGVEALF